MTAFSWSAYTGITRAPTPAYPMIRSWTLPVCLVLQPGLFEQTNNIKELRSEAGLADFANELRVERSGYAAEEGSGR
jgi:hypothetical protein